MKRFSLFVMAGLMALVSYAQQNIGYRQAQIVSPVINPDKSVTFTIDAPKADDVKILGDWSGAFQVYDMQRTPDGLWTLTTDPLSSELYIYRMLVDGVTTLDPLNPFVRRDVGNNFSYFFIDGGPADFYQVQNVPHGNVVQTWYHSEKLGADRRLQVYTPPYYNDSNRSYPVLYLLHGSGGDENAWMELGCTARIMDNLIAQGLIEPMIVVMPNGNPSKQAAPGETSENLSYRPAMSHEFPGYKNGDYEIAFPEIIAYVDWNFRTIPDRKHRAVAGLSMGGFHSLHIAANYPDLFGYTGMFSAGFPGEVDKSRPAYKNLDAKYSGLKDQELLWIAVGVDDFLYQSNQEFMRKLDNLGVKYEYHESPNGHVWSNWRQYLLEFAPKLFRQEQ